MTGVETTTTLSEGVGIVIAAVGPYLPRVGLGIPNADLPPADFEALYDPNQTRLTQAATQPM